MNVGTIVIVDENISIDPKLAEAINMYNESQMICAIYGASTNRGLSKTNLSHDLICATREVIWEYSAPEYDYEFNPPRVPKNIKQRKAPKQSFRNTMRSVNRNH